MKLRKRLTNEWHKEERHVLRSIYFDKKRENLMESIFYNLLKNSKNVQ